jgi:tetratricopeptide (TPR) repeat protein
MAHLELLAPARGAHKASVVFLHGLDGDARDTWRSCGPDKAIWLAWLAEDIEGLSVWIVGYDAPASGWQRAGAHPADHATAIVERLYRQPELATGDLFLVGHSLGGLIIKMMLGSAEFDAKSHAHAQSFLNRVRKVGFLATPHTGADLGRIANWLRVIARPSEATKALADNDPNLRRLNEGYREIARAQAIDHLILTERLPLVVSGWKWGVVPYRIPLGVIVKPDSADPGVGVKPIPITTVDHIQIAKPKDRKDEIYFHVRDFLERPPPAAPVDPAVPEIKKAAEENAALHDRSLQEIKALREDIAREKGVPPEVLKPLFERLGQMDLSRDQMREKAQWAIAHILAQSQEARPDSNLGRDLDEVIAEARKLLREVRTAEALQVLQKHDDAEIAEFEEAQQMARRSVERRLVILQETARIQKTTFDYAAAKQSVREMIRLDAANVWALIELGDIEAIVGTTQAALSAYQAGLNVVRNAGDERNAAVFLERIGDVLRSRNDLDGALKNYNEGLEIRRRLMNEDPSHAGRAQDVAISLFKLAQIDEQREDTSSACSRYREARDIIGALAEKAPDIMQLQQQRSVLDERVSMLCGA